MLNGIIADCRSTYIFLLRSTNIRPLSVRYHSTQVFLLQSTYVRPPRAFCWFTLTFLVYPMNTGTVPYILLGHKPFQFHHFFTLLLLLLSFFVPLILSLVFSPSILLLPSYFFMAISSDVSFYSLLISGALSLPSPISLVKGMINYITQVVNQIIERMSLECSYIS